MTGWELKAGVTGCILFAGFIKLRKCVLPEDGNRSRGVLDEFIKKPENIVSVLTLVAVFWYTSITRDLLSATQHSFADVQRAFVFASPGHTYYYTFGEGLQITLSNSGTTPTKNLVVYWDRLLSPKPIGPSFPFPDMDISGRVIDRPKLVHSLLGPKSQIYSDTVVYTTQQMESINSGKLFAYQWGWARYEDVFSGTFQHIMRYCLQVSFFSGNLEHPNADTAIWTRPCDYGNCADEECRAQGLP